MKLTRLEAIQDVRLGRGIQVSFVGLSEIGGRPATFKVIVRRSRRGGAEAVIDCDTMRRSYRIAEPLTWVQVLNFIRRHYDRRAA